MAAIKPIEVSGEKWTRRASAAAQDLIAGVRNPRRSWSSAAQEAGSVYRQAVIAAANAGRFEAGVRSAGDEKWRTNAEAKGATRYPEGVSLAVGEWQKGYGPYQQGYAAFSLPKRGVKGSAQNFQISQAVGQLFNTIKQRRGAS